MSRPTPAPQRGLDEEQAASLKHALTRYCPDLSPRARGPALERLDRYAAVLTHWARRTNLVSQADLPALATRHLIPALALRPALRSVPHDRVADIGSGAGLPGIPLAITTPEARFDLVESRRKRASFLRAVARELNLPTLRIVHQRAEELPADPPYQVALARAVGDPNHVTGLVAKALDRDGFMLVTLPPSASQPGMETPSTNLEQPCVRYALWRPFLDPPPSVESHVEE